MRVPGSTDSLRRVVGLLPFALIASLSACNPPPASEGEGEGEEGEGEEGEGEGEGEGAAFSATPAGIDLRSPFDAAPSPDGQTIFFTAQGSDGAQHALWKINFDGSGAPTELATGLVAPLGVVVSSDGATVFVGDGGDEAGVDPDKLGALFSVPANGGARTRITATEGFAIKGLDLVDDTGDVITFTGRDPADGAVGVFSLIGGDVSLIAKGAPFSDPSGVARAANGDVYVVDTSGGEDGRGVVFKVTAGVATVFASGLKTGFPAGTALNHDEDTLLVSGLDEDNNALVYVVDLATGAVDTVNTGLEGNDEAGGLHRSQSGDEFAWCGKGTVYAITIGLGGNDQ